MDILKDKSYRSYDYISRYSAFPYYFNTEDNKYIYGTTARLKQDIGYSLYIVKRNDTFDSIALEYYNTPTLFWVIADFNKIQDPFTKLEVGQKIKVPTLSAIQFNLDETRNDQ